MARLSEATVDMAKGTVVSDKPVNVQMADGTLDAQRLEITGRGELMIFYGGVTMHSEAGRPVRPACRQTMSASRMTCRLYLAVAIAFALGGPATAQAQGAPKDSTTSSSTVTGPPNALQGFSQNRDKPIQIDAARLEVRDKDKVATFFGDAKADVKVVQGDVTMRSKVLVVFYEQDEPAKAGAAKTAKAAAPGPGGSSQIKRLEAKGNVDRHPEGPDRHRRERAVRHEVQHRHHDRQRDHDPVRQRAEG